MLSTVLLVNVIIIWLYLLYVLWTLPTDEDLVKASMQSMVVSAASHTPQLRAARRTTTIEFPNRFRVAEPHDEPPSLSEIEKNITTYLSLLHQSFMKLQGAKAVPIDIWEAYLNVTKSTMIKWDDENRHRYPKTRQDNSIFVSVGSYRGDYYNAYMIS